MLFKVPLGNQLNGSFKRCSKWKSDFTHIIKETIYMFYIQKTFYPNHNGENVFIFFSENENILIKIKLDKKVI